MNPYYDFGPDHLVHLEKYTENTDISFIETFSIINGGVRKGIHGKFKVSTTLSFVFLFF